MPGKLKKEIRHKSAFRSSEVEAFLNLLRTADTLRRQVDALFKPFKITGAQYNVLRVLQDAGGAGRSCSEIGRRMIEEHPDVTRLLDRMEKAQLIERYRDQKDRRAVLARMTPKAVAILKALEDPVYTAHLSQFSALSKDDLREFIKTLEILREEAARREVRGPNRAELDAHT
jgi:DNA-binding MarR family transcriptional regulator